MELFGGGIGAPYDLVGLLDLDHAVLARCFIVLVNKLPAVVPF